MKRNIFTGIPGILSLLTICIGAHSQIASADIHPAGELMTSKKFVQKKHSAYTLRVNPVVVRNFIRAYKYVTGEKWFEVKDGYIVMFHKDDYNYQVAYEKKGDWLYTILSYTENKLPKDIRHLIKSNYYDYDINLVQEIQRPKDPSIYIFQLIGKTELIKLRVCDNEMQLLQKFKKSE